MGDALQLPALVVLAGITLGAVVGGVPGAILATPLIATCPRNRALCPPQAAG